MDADSNLFSVKNEYYIGNYSAVLTEAHTCLCSTPAEEVERDWFQYRAYIAMGNYDVVLDAPDNQPQLQAVKLLASYMSSPELREVALVNLKQWLSEPGVARNPAFQVVAGTVFCHEENYAEALKVMHPPATLELMAMTVQVYIMINRMDLAEKQLRAMQTTDDDATLTQLSNALVAAAMGGERLNEACIIFQELGEKYSETPLTLNGQAACQMAMGNHSDAEKLLLQAQAKGVGDAQTTENLLVCGTQLRKPAELLGRLATVLRSKNPNSVVLTTRQALSDNFDRLAAKYVQ